MRRFISAVVVLLLTRAAFAGDFDTEISADFLYGDSTAAGEKFDAEEVGMRIRADLLEFDDRLSVNFDYLGREAVGGEHQNVPHRLLYRAEVSYQLIASELTLGLGRFIPESAIFLPVDGARATYAFNEKFTLRAFGGRRGVTTSRRNVELDRFLPAFGGGGTLDLEWARVDVAVAYAGDDIFALEDEFAPKEYDALNFVASGVFQPIAELRLGTRETFVQQAVIALGPTWSEYSVDVRAVDLFGAAVFADYRPMRALRFALDLQYQSAAVIRDVDPTFADATVTVSYAPFDLGWIRPSARARKRPDRLELRYGASVEIAQLGLEGLEARGFVTYEDVRFDDDAAAKPNLDRLLWSAALGWSGFDVDVEAGARFIDRSEGPFSNRGQDATVAADLAQFVLEAQRIVFLRAFYAHDWFFAGVDLERSIEDPELRFFLQAGTFLEESW